MCTCVWVCAHLCMCACTRGTHMHFLCLCDRRQADSGGNEGCLLCRESKHLGMFKTIFPQTLNILAYFSGVMGWFFLLRSKVQEMQPSPLCPCKSFDDEKHCPHSKGLFLLSFFSIWMNCVFHCCAKLLQLCLTLCDPLDCNLPDSSVHGILQAWILEWIAMPSSRGSSQPRDRTQVSCLLLSRQVPYP